MREQSSRGRMIAGIKPAQPRPKPESAGSSGKARRVSGAGEQVKKGNAADEKRRIREAEKAERLMHLIFWGPN